MAKECENCNNMVLDNRQIVDSHNAWNHVLCMKCQMLANEGELDINSLEMDNNNTNVVDDIEQEIVEPGESSVEIINPDELTTEQKLAIAEMVEQGEDKTKAIAKVTGNYQPIAITGYTPDEVETIRNTVARGANDSQLAMFLHLCQTYQLDPFLKEIFYSSDLETIMTSRDGYLKIAQRDSNFNGMKSAVVHENDEFKMDVVNNNIEHTFTAKDRGDIVGAWAMVLHKNREPVIQFSPFKEYDRGKNTWAKYPSAMIQKCAEAPALKRQFGITGLVTKEEMGED